MKQKCLQGKSLPLKCLKGQSQSCLNPGSELGICRGERWLETKNACQQSGCLLQAGPFSFCSSTPLKFPIEKSMNFCLQDHRKEFSNDGEGNPENFWELDLNGLSIRIWWTWQNMKFQAQDLQHLLKITVNGRWQSALAEPW